MTDISDAAEKLEPKMARAFLRAIEKIKDDISIKDLTAALETNDLRIIMRLFPVEKIYEALEPCGEIVREAFFTGGKLGAKEVNKL